jgi:adenosylmethionine---8-amino-7-oxononanoate aminotransferase
LRKTGAVLSERTIPVSDAELLAADARHVWHPYAPIRDPQTPLLVASAGGIRLRLRDGLELIDGMSSWWCAIHGYRHPVIDAALGEQVQDMAHVMLGGLTHEPVVALATRLAALAPAGLEQVFFADSGSVAVEVAIKLCLQYQRAVGRPGRRRLITVRGGYHGDTLGAMSLCDPVDGMHAQFAGTLAGQIFAERPPAGYDAPLDPAYAAHLSGVVERHAEEAAAIVVEPVV